MQDLSLITRLNIATTDYKNKCVRQVTSASNLATMKAASIGCFGYGSSIILSGLNCTIYNIPYALKELSKTHNTDNQFQKQLNISVLSIAALSASSLILNMDSTSWTLFKILIVFSTLYFYPIVQSYFSGIPQTLNDLNEDFLFSGHHLIMHFCNPNKRSPYIFNCQYDIEYKNKFASDFVRLNNDPQRERKTLCAFFIPSSDKNGAIFNIQNHKETSESIRYLQKFYAVFAKVIQSKVELFQFLEELRNSFPKRSIKLVVVCGHGLRTDITFSETNRFRAEDIQQNEFKRLLAPKADIILHACETAKGIDSFARRIALQNRGIKVHAPPFNIYNSTITLEMDKNEIPSVKEILYFKENTMGFFWNKGKVFHCPDSHPEIEEIVS